MDTSQPSHNDCSSSPDPLSHTANIYDASGAEDEQLAETDNDDMDFQPTTDESEDAEFFDPSEDVEAVFHGMVISFSPVHECSLSLPIHHVSLNVGFVHNRC